MNRGFPDRVAVFALDALAVHRLTRLVTADTITEPLRDRIIEVAYRRDTIPNWKGEPVPRARGASPYVRYTELDGEVAEADTSHHEFPGWSWLVDNDLHPPKVAVLVTCRWCASVWIAAGVLTARRVAPRWWAPAARMLAWSSLSTFMARLEDE